MLLHFLLPERYSRWWVMVIVVGLSSCLTHEENTQQEGYRPIYTSKEEGSRISFLPAQPLKQTGKIYSKDHLIFVNELQKGIHIIDNTDPKNPRNMAFISIPGNVDIAVKGNTLYADNFSDLLVLDISNPAQASVLKRIPDALPNGIHNYPPYTDVYFECVDPAKGVVTGWEKTMLTNPKCRR